MRNKSEKLLDNFGFHTLQNDEEQDHPPITPMNLPSKFSPFEDDSDESKVYDLIVDYFFATMSSNAKINQVFSKYELGDHTFVGKHTEILEEGFLEHLPMTNNEMSKYTISNAKIIQDGSYEIVNYKVQKSIPIPKSYMTETELVRIMENEGIGTDGTIPSHIDKIIERGYVKVEKDDSGVRSLIPTKRGIALAEGFQELDKKLFEPYVRQYIEKQ